MSDVFISYSRKNSEFVRILHEALEKSNRETWVDWEGIAKGTEWWKEIEAGIEGANTFVFVISPDSVASTVCQDEIRHAIRYNKQILPIVYREPVNENEPNNKNFDFEPNNSAHKAIRSHNWLFFREEDDFSQSLIELIDALNLDIAHVKGHTRFLVRALEWDNKGRKDGFLLKDENLIEAEDWLKLGVTKDPKPTDLQKTYIENSRKVEDANNQAVLILKEAKETAEKQIDQANQQVTAAKIKVDAATVRKKQIIRQGSIFLGVIVVGAGTALSFAGFKTIEAQNNLENTNIQVGATEAKALWIENPQILDNLLLALKTGNEIPSRSKLRGI